MMILTARVYAVYWAYKNFLALDPTPAKRPKILAGINGLLFIFRFNHLMKLVEAAGAKYDVSVKFPRILYVICLFVIFPAIGITLNYYAVPFGWMVPVVLTTWVLSKPNEALLKINEKVNPRAHFAADLNRYDSLFIAVVVAFVIFFPKDVNLSPTNFLEEQREKQHCRWINDEPSNKVEQEDKTRRLKAMDKFWEHYKSSGANLADSGKNYADDYDFRTLLERVHPLLQCDLKQSKNVQGKTVFEFTIFSQSAEMIPMIRTMVSRAPKFSNCNYYSYKQPVPPSQIQEKMKSEQRFDLKGFKVKCSLRRDNLIAVDITSKQFENSTDEEVQVAASNLCEYVLGQENRFSWLGPISIGGGDGDMPVDVAAKEFKNDFDALKKTAESKMPNKLFSELSFDELGKAISYENTEKALDEKTFPQPGFVPNIYLALDRYPFHSKRFSKNGENIVLFNSFSKKKKKKIVDDFLEHLDKNLMGQKVGRIIYGIHDDEAGKLKALCCISDFKKAKSLFRKLCDEFHLSHQSWILVLDSELENEEIRLFPDTKPYVAGK